jgi:hypothetical protein
MRLNIAKIWLAWLCVMAALAGMTWVLFMFPLPGGSAGLPTLEEVVEYFAYIGVGATLTVFAVIFLPPILATCFEIWKAPRSGGLTPAGNAAKRHGFFARLQVPHVTVTVDRERFRFEGPGVPDGSPLAPATAVRIGHDLKVAAIGDEALASALPGMLIRPFAVPPRHDTPWLHEEPLVQYCRYYLMLASAPNGQSFPLARRPAVTVHKAHALRGFFRGRETEVLDRVFRAAGASVVRFI